MSLGAVKVGHGNGTTEDQCSIIGGDYVPDQDAIGLFHVPGHGAFDSGRYAFNMASSGFKALFRVLAEIGHPILSCACGRGTTNLTQPNNGHTQPHWNADPAEDLLDELIAFGRARYGLHATRVRLIGVSMGCLPILKWARNNLAEVACAYLVIPVGKLEDFRAHHAGIGDPLGYSAEIYSAYGGSGPYNTALPNHDPEQFADELDFPIKIAASATDSVVPYSQVQDLANILPNAELVNLDPDLGHIANFDPMDVAEFMGQHY